MSNRLARPRRTSRSNATQRAEFHRQLIETAPQMLWTAHRDGSIEFVNGRVCEFHGRSRSRIEGWGWRDLVHPDDWQRSLALWTKAIKKSQPYEVQCRLRRHDGRFIWHLVSAMPQREAGRVVRWFGTTVEIESQKRAERLLAKAREALQALVGSRAEEPAAAYSERSREIDERLRESDRQFRAFLDSMPAIAWIKDSALRYVWVSASYTRLHGKNVAQVQGRDDFAVWPEDLARLFRKDDELALRAGGPVQFLESVPFVDGSAARWMVVKFPLPDASGAPGVAGIGFDVTDDHLALEGADSEGRAVDRLSGRERQVMQLIVDGHTSAEVGARLGLSPKSVDTYRSRLMAKLGIGDLPTLVKFALRHGLTSKR